jgi:3-deoxy-D-manno-octulosonate 8-phosphate phosphatase (KDO 8-P phosphatase)
MKDIIQRAKKIKLLILDVDGILTNGSIVLDQKGGEIKFFNVKDGFGIVLFHAAGLETAILSARSTGAVEARAKDLKIKYVYQDASPKTDAFKEICKKAGVSSDEVCFMGDDLPDLCVLKKVGLSVTVPNAVNEVKEIVNHITKAEGGVGAVREVVELILEAQGKWNGIVEGYLSK